MFEHRRKRPLAPKQFARRVGKHLLFAVGVVVIALGIGVCGYHFIAKLSWIDALLNASMILSGMGPADALHSDAAKLFASFYALFSGLVFLGVVVLLMTPFVHRLLHKFHWEEE